MTPDQITRMATLAGARPGFDNQADMAFLQDFAALVADAATAPLHARIADLEAQLYAIGAGQSIKPQIQADAAQAPEVRIRTSAPSAWDWASLNNAADKIIRGKMVWKRFIDGTPLANDIACWMADFALEHAAPPEVPAPQEPVAWRVRPFNYGIGHEGVDALTTRKEQCEMWERKGWKVEPLYAAPQPARQPLTDSQVKELVKKHPAEDLCRWSYGMGIKDAEAAHGITGGQP